MASTDARPVPQKNVAFRVYFPILDNDGDPVSAASALDSEVSKDGAAFADATSEATEIGTSGIYYLDLTNTEMNADCVVVQVKTSTTDAKTVVLVFYPQETGDIKVDVTSFGGSAGTFSGGRPEVNTSHAAGTAWGSGAITAASIASDAIAAAKIATGAITAAKFAASAIDATAIATGAITSAKFAASAIDATAIASNAITSAKIATGAITTATFAAGAINAAALGADAITAAKIADGAIDAATFAAGAINATAIATGAITAAKFAAGAIDAAAIATDAIGAAEISAAAGSKLADIILRRAFTSTAAGSDGDTVAGRNALQALRALRNRVNVAAGTATVYAEDDSTSAWTAAVTTTAGNPISQVDPA